MATWMNSNLRNLRLPTTIAGRREWEEINLITTIDEQNETNLSLSPIDYIIQISWFELYANYYMYYQIRGKYFNTRSSIITLRIPTF